MIEKETLKTIRIAIEKYPEWMKDGGVFGGKDQDHVGAYVFASYLNTKYSGAKLEITPQNINFNDFFEYVNGLQEEGEKDYSELINKLQDVRDSINEKKFLGLAKTFDEIFYDLGLEGGIDQTKSNYDNILGSAYKAFPTIEVPKEGEEAESAEISKEEGAGAVPGEIQKEEKAPGAEEKKEGKAEAEEKKEIEKEEGKKEEEKKEFEEKPLKKGEEEEAPEAEAKIAEEPTPVKEEAKPPEEGKKQIQPEKPAVEEISPVKEEIEKVEEAPSGEQIEPSKKEEKIAYKIPPIKQETQEILVKIPGKPKKRRKIEKPGEIPELAERKIVAPTGIIGGLRKRVKKRTKREPEAETKREGLEGGAPIIPTPAPAGIPGPSAKKTGGGKMVRLAVKIGTGLVAGGALLHSASTPDNLSAPLGGGSTVMELIKSLV